jgi:hypothetical protein
MLTFLAVAGLSGTCDAADAAKNVAVTFAKDVAPIFQEKCEECHRNGTAAPMSLVTYQEVRPWAKAIKDRVLTRQMPPWHIDKTVGIQKFQNDRSLTEEQINLIARWVDSGSPPGDPKDMPPAKQWPSGAVWRLAKKYGEPDLVIKSADYTMAARGQDTWWKPISQVPVTEPRWVRALEMRAGTPAGTKITHHAIAQLEQEEPGVDPNDPAKGPGSLMEWAVGKQYEDYRENTGKLLLPGSQIRWDIHLHASGEEVRDHVELAVFFYPKGQVPKYRTRLTEFQAIPGQRGTSLFMLDIPPNTVKETQSFTVLKAPARIENFQPHMHLRGKAMSMEAILPDGTRRMLSYVDNFNFNWMNNYIYADDAAPVLPKGTVICVTALHDNTAANKNNPDPNQWVGFGDRTVDEMAKAWANVTYISEDDYNTWLAKHQPDRSEGRRTGGDQ